MSRAKLEVCSQPPQRHLCTKRSLKVALFYSAFNLQLRDPSSIIDDQLFLIILVHIVCRKSNGVISSFRTVVLGSIIFSFLLRSYVHISLHACSTDNYAPLRTLIHNHLLVKKISEQDGYQVQFVSLYTVCKWTYTDDYLFGKDNMITLESHHP